MARRALTLLLVFAGMVAGIEGLQRIAAWQAGELAVPALIDWLLMVGLLPLLWLWWQYLSPFGKKRGQCLKCHQTEK